MRPNQDRGTVTVLGAGVAGLATAWELERLGYRVELLEGSGRLGGRVHTHRFGTGPGAPVAELGAMRIPAGHRRVLDYVDRLGLTGELRPFRGLRAEPVRVPPPGPHAAETRLVGARLTAMVDAVAPPPVREDVRRDLRGGLLDRLDRLDLRPYASAPDGVHELLAAHPELRSACSGELRDFLDDILTETGPSLLRIRGGMSRLVDELAARIRGPIRLGRPVVGLDVRPDEVLVRVREGGRTTPSTGDSPRPRRRRSGGGRPSRPAGCCSPASTPRRRRPGSRVRWSRRRPRSRRCTAIARWPRRPEPARPTGSRHRPLWTVPAVQRLSAGRWPPPPRRRAG
jgi:monoamine oxidase